MKTLPLELIKTTSDFNKIGKILDANNIPLKREGRGGHGIRGTKDGSFPVEEHGEASKSMRYAIYKQARALLILAGTITAVIIAVWLWNNCPGWLFDLLYV